MYTGQSINPISCIAPYFIILLCPKPDDLLVKGRALALNGFNCTALQLTMHPTHIFLLGLPPDNFTHHSLKGRALVKK
jgi:hypothetical protein